jgi:hypothetical protein
MTVAGRVIQSGRIDPAGNRQEVGAIEALAPVRLEIANAGEDHVVLGDWHVPWNRRTLRMPAASGEHRQPHHVEVAGGVLIGIVEVGVGVEPDYAEVVRPDSGRRP